MASPFVLRFILLLLFSFAFAGAPATAGIESIARPLSGAVRGLCERFLGSPAGPLAAPLPVDPAAFNLQSISAKWKIEGNDFATLAVAVTRSIDTLINPSALDAKLVRQRHIDSFLAEVAQNFRSATPSPAARRLGHLQVLDKVFMAYAIGGELYLEVQGLSSPSQVLRLSEEAMGAAPAEQALEVALQVDPQLDLNQLLSMVDLLRKSRLFNQSDQEPDVKAMIAYLVAHTRPPAKSVRVAKRVIDVAAGSVGLLMTAPLYPLIAAAIYLDSPGPIFYLQERSAGEVQEGAPLDPATGRPVLKIRPFKMFKFRSMREDAEKNGAALASKNDDRVTTVGRFLRKTRLDEIPQFLNVLWGDMSLVGPRPEREQYVDQLEVNIPGFKERMRDLKPGITGLAQISLDYLGRLPGEDDNDQMLTPQEQVIRGSTLKLLHDLAYHEAAAQGFWRYLQMEMTIILRTPAVMAGGLSRKALGR